MSERDTITDIANIRSRAVAVPAEPGQIAIENIAGVLKQVDDQGTVSSLGGAGAGTVTSVAATALGLLAVAGTPTVAPTVGMASMADQRIVGNVSGGSAVPIALTAAQVNTMLGNIAAGWAAESWNDVQPLIPTLNRYIDSDLNDGRANGIATNNAISTTINSGAYRISSAGASADISLGNTATQICVVTPKVTVWAARSRFYVQSFTAGKFVRVFALFDLAGNGFEILGSGTVSTTVFQARHWYAGGGSTEDFSCGTVGTLGQATCPTNAAIMTKWTFDGTSIRGYFGGTLALTLTGSQLTNMVTAASYFYFGGNDQAAVHIHDGVFFATVAST